MSNEPAAVAYDPWDSNNGDLWFVHMDPETVERLWSEAQDTLYINRDNDGFWLSEPGVMGQDQFQTLEAAKAAGNAVLEARTAAMEANLLKDAGLDPSAWSFEYQEGARFIYRENPSLKIEIDIEGTSVAKRFMPCEGEDDIGEYATASEAAAALVDRPAPGI